MQPRLRYATERVRFVLPFLANQQRALSTTKAQGTNTINNVNGATAGDSREEICEATAKKQKTEIFSPRELSGNGLLSQAKSEASRGQMPEPCAGEQPLLPRCRTGGTPGSDF